MAKLAKAELLPPERKHLGGRPKKPFDIAAFDSIPVAAPESPMQAIENLLIFDARALDKETQLQLLHILPELIQIRRAWKAHYLEHGCTSCPKADEKAAIAARMRSKGFSWESIFETVAPNIHTSLEQKRFRNSVYWKLEHPKERAERNPNSYGGGGFCAACQVRILARMRKRYRKLMDGRNPAAELATFKDALALKYNAAQRLLNGDD